MEPNQNPNPEQNPEQAPPANEEVQSPAVTQSQGEPANADEAQQDVDKTGGVEDGTVEKTNESLAPEVRDRIDNEEKVVHETDENGNVVGWHKEPADGSTPEEQNAVLQPGQEDQAAEETNAGEAQSGGNE